MRIALVIPFGENSNRMTCSEFFHKYVKQPEMEVIFCGTIVPGETSSDVVGGIAGYMAAIKKAERDGFDAVVTGPHPDLGIEEARELVKIPVLGPLQVAAHIGLILGRKVSVISPSLSLRRWIEYRTRSYSLEHLVSSRDFGMSVENILPYYEEYLKSGKYGEILDRLVQTGIKCIEEDNASALTIGCGGLVWLVEPAREELKKRGYDITFVNPYPVAVEIAKALVNLGISHGDVCYPGYKWNTPDGAPRHI